MSYATIHAVKAGSRWLALLLVTLGGGALLQSQGPTAAVNAVVRVSGTLGDTPFHGSGFVVALTPRVATIVTAFHVIEGKSKVEVRFAADPMRSLPVAKLI